MSLPWPNLTTEQWQARLAAQPRRKYSEDQPRDDQGQWTDAGGGASSGDAAAPRESTREPSGLPDHGADAAKYAALKTQWSTVNDALLGLVDTPDSPEARAKLDELKAICKEMQALHLDPGGIEGVGLPGGPRDLVIVGAGPGGLSAAVMGGTDGLDTLFVDANTVAGGQSKWSSRIENFPGFPVGVTGETLARNLTSQAERVGAEGKLGVRVTGLTIDDATGLKTVTLSNGETVTARAVVIAGGLEARQLEFPGEASPTVTYLDSKQLVADSAGKAAVVIGGSNGAAQAALGAAKRAEAVTVISRSPIEKGMSNYQVEAIRNNPKITVIEGDEIQAFDPGSRAVTLKSGKSVAGDAVGIFAGSLPDTNWLPARLTRQSHGPERGKIVVGQNLETSIPGVFAIGDVRVGSIGRIGGAVGDGQLAERNAFLYFETLGHGAARAPKKAATTLAHPAPTVAIYHGEWDHYLDQLFALDKLHPWLSQTVEPAPAPAKGVVYLDTKYDEDEPRDEQGRWTDGGGGGESPAPPPAGVLAEMGRPDGGFTYHAVTGVVPKTGFAVSLHKTHERVLAAADASAPALMRYAHDQWSLLNHPGRYLGGWHNPKDGKVYLDVSTVVSSAADAERLGREHAQLAYFDLEQGHSVPIDPHAKRHTPDSASRRPAGRPPVLRGHPEALGGADGPSADAGGNRRSPARVGDLRDDGSRVEKYSEDQPRDDQGQWTDEGGGGGGRHDSAPRRPGRTDTKPIGDGTLHSPGDALHSLANGEPVNIAREDVREFLEKAAKRDDDPDLTDVHVDGLLIFGGNGLGIARADMPQISTAAREDFLTQLHDEGISSTKQNVSPHSLYPVQREISARRVGEKMRKMGRPGSTKLLPPILISKDNYVLDGHHRWAEMAALAIEHPKITMPVIRLGASHARALTLMHAYADAHGIANKPIDARALRPGVVYLEKYSEDQARDENGQWTDEGGGGSGASRADLSAWEGEGGSIGTPEQTAELQAQATSGIAAIANLEEEALANVDWTDLPGVEANWDFVDSETTDKVRSSFIERELEQGDIEVEIDVNDYIDQAELSRDARQEFESDLGNSTDPALADFDVAWVDEVSPDGVTLTDDAPEISSQAQRTLDRLASTAYSSAEDSARDSAYDDSRFQEAESDAQYEEASNRWDDLSTDDKFAYAHEHDFAVGRSVEPGLPTTWDPLHGPGTGAEEDTVRTGAMARSLVTTRSEDLMAARGLLDADGSLLGPTMMMPEAVAGAVWDEWKVSSSSAVAQALQLAAAEELGGVHRLTPAEVEQARAAATRDFGPRGMDALKAYSRAQWETTQYLLDKAGVTEVETFRGLMMPQAEIAAQSKAPLGPSAQLPNLKLQRNGLQSATMTAKVANDWNGVDVRRDVPHDRVVLRVKTPAVGVFSIPAFGQNVHEEREVVLLGTKGEWKWDAWTPRAPEYGAIPLTKAAAPTTPSLVIDMHEHDKGPHWLTPAGGTPRRRPADRLKFSEDEPRDDQGRWTDGGGGGSAAASSHPGPTAHAETPSANPTTPTAAPKLAQPGVPAVNHDPDSLAAARAAILAKRPVEEVLAALGPTAAPQYAALFARAAAGQGELSTLLKDIVTEVPGAEGRLGPIKKLDRSVEKMVTKDSGDARHVHDVVRATAVVTTAEQVQPMVSAIDRHLRATGGRIIEHEDWTHVPTPLGYRAVNLKAQLPGGFIGEMQVTTKAMLAAKNGAGHTYYEEARHPATTPARMRELEIASQDLYARAWAAKFVRAAAPYDYLYQDSFVFRRPTGVEAPYLETDVWEPETRTWRRVDRDTAVDVYFGGSRFLTPDEVANLTADETRGARPRLDRTTHAPRATGQWQRVGNIAGPAGREAPAVNVAAIAQRARGLIETLTPDAITRLIGEMVDRALAARPRPQDGGRGEKGEKGLRGEQGRHGEKGLPGDHGPVGPAGERGADGARGRDGRDGLHGAAGERGLPGDRGEMGPVGPAGPPGDVGASGPGGERGLIGDKGLTGEQGLMGPAGAAGRDGEPGPAGLGFDDLVIEHDGERGFTVAAVRGDHRKTLGTFTLPAMIHRGVWRPGVDYRYQDVVTWGGSQWVCMQPTTAAKPGDPGTDARAWVMAVRKGDVGKAGPSGERGVRGEKGESGKPGPERW